MFEIKVTIEAPGIAAALDNLALAMSGARKDTSVAPQQPVPAPINPAPTPQQQPIPAPTQTTAQAPAYSAPAPAQTAVPTPQQPTSTPTQTTVQAPAYSVPAPAQTAAPAPAVPSNPAPAPAPGGVPLAAAPQYTIDQIMAAGGMLMDAGRVNDLMALLQRFGVVAVTDLKPEMYGAFATELRNMGAKI